MRLGEIGQIALTVSDLTQAIEFYRDKLGLPFLFQVPNLAFLDCNGIRLMLGQAEGSTHLLQTHSASRSSQNVTKVVSRGGHLWYNKTRCEIDSTREGLGYMAYFADPEGNTFGIMQDDPDAK